MCYFYKGENRKREELGGKEKPGSEKPQVVRRGSWSDRWQQWRHQGGPIIPGRGKIKVTDEGEIKSISPPVSRKKKDDAQ